LAGAYISFRFFYIPPFLFDVAICVILLTAAVQLLRQQTMFADGKNGETINSASAKMPENPSHARITPYFLRNICSLSNNFPE
jgi:hypothetical protein